MQNKTDIDVICSLGFGADILVSGDNTSILLMEPPKKLDRFTFGIVDNWQLDLTVEQALDLSKKLFDVATKTKDWLDSLPTNLEVD